MQKQSGYILALDNGTTGNRAFLFNSQGKVVGQAYKELTQYYPQPGWLEHDAEEIWQDTCFCIESAIKSSQISSRDIVALGLTVQRETCLLWDKTTGKPLHRAIVWQDRRTAAMCQNLQEKGFARDIYQRTGLVIDAYFSATKLKWLLEQIKGVDLNNVLAGTIDTWVLWNLTGGKVHATDHSNASRTMLMNLSSGQWDETLLNIFEIPVNILPQIQPSLSHFGVADTPLLGAKIPITAILGDQHAALFAHGCDKPGLMKCTYGTGSFLMANTGSEILRSPHQLLSTIAWTDAEKITYALEGSIFTSGACIQWLRDGMKLISNAAETETMAKEVSDNGGVYFVPAFSGLGAPHWDMSARGAFLGLTGGVKKEHMVRAVLEAIAYQVKEVVDAINASTQTPITNLMVDGGACKNNFLMQFQADILGIPVERPAILDMTVQGAAFAAGIKSGFWNNYQQLVGDASVASSFTNRSIDTAFQPGQVNQVNQINLQNFQTWQKAVERTKNWIN